jgi:hypothetical protein
MREKGRGKDEGREREGECLWPSKALIFANYLSSFEP